MVAHFMLLGHPLSTPVLHQPTRTTVNIHDNLLERICLFAGVFEQRRTTTTLWICLCTVQVRGSNPLGSTHFWLDLQVKCDSHAFWVACQSKSPAHSSPKPPQYSRRSHTPPHG